MRRNGLRACSVATVAVVAGALGAASSAPAATAAPETGLLRVAHLSPSTPAVDMYAQGPGLPLTRVAGDVSYRGLTSYLTATPGVYTLQARPAGADPASPPALTTSIAVGPGSAQTAAFVDVGPGATPEAEVLIDQTAPAAAGSAQVRVVAAAGGVGAIDMVAEGGPQLADDVFYGAASGYATVAARTWTMDVTTSTGDRARATLPVPSTSVSSVFVTRDPQGALAVTAVPDAASAAAPAAPSPAAPAAPSPAAPAAPSPAAPAPPAAGAPTTAAIPAPAHPAPARRAPVGGVSAGFGGLAGALETSGPSAAPLVRAMPVVSGPAERRGPGTVRPTGLVVPAAGIDADGLGDLGIDTRGHLRAPPDPQSVGWFSGGAVPGDAGPAVLVGHVDSWRGPGVFWRLHDLRAGDPVDVPRSDGTVAHFVVDSVERFDKDAFPTDRVYGPTSGPTLRLVTCGGAFDRVARSYVDNVVVFASPR